MKYRKLGKTGLNVSEIALGGWLTFGDLLDYEQSKKIINKAFALGINFFDTADSYNHGKSEEIIGRAIADFKREELVIATKCFFPLDINNQNPNLRGLSRKHIFESVNASLKRLKVDYIDLFQFHRFDLETPIEETLDAINDLIRIGKILYFGVSQWNEEQIISANSYSKSRNGYVIASSQNLYNLFHRDVEKSFLEFCKNNGLGFIAYSPLARGVLSNKYLNEIPQDSRYSSRYKETIYDYKEENLHKVKELEILAKKYKCSISQIALAFYLSFKEISSLIIGSTKVTQIEDCVKACNIKLEDSDIKTINKIFSL